MAAECSCIARVSLNRAERVGGGGGPGQELGFTPFMADELGARESEHAERIEADRA